MVRFGINLMAWSGQTGPDEVALFPGLASLGYDGVELPIFAPESVDRVMVRSRLEQAGLACTVSSALPRGASLLDPGECPAGVAFLERCLETAAACGATLLCGPIYHPVGVLPGRAPTVEEWRSAVVGMRAVGERAADRGMTVALEPLNRFETHFLNTVDDGIRFVEEVDRPAVGLHLDTFHMNVEEKTVPGALRRAGPWLRHFHASENDRGVVGTGHVDWLAVQAALTDIGYGGWVTAETFAGSVPEIAAATAIWRRLVPDAWTYADQSLGFMKQVFRPG